MRSKQISVIRSITWIVRCELDKFQALYICGILSRVHDVCHVLEFGFWGMTMTPLL
ncbi:hypothetical protein SLEP1_g6915 [Rubroshorea leprosula]|uniref:Uncharacterized protein n=1 Tax=Rubroshorea leprosula TaxID=152421 RepID=A0AAV5I7N3_9ROSI|nr:hypothetical protein SLEP1_g6915 [Rubroshorea leprosula]